MNLDESYIDSLREKAEQALTLGDIPKVILIFQEMEQAGVWQITARIAELYETGYKHDKCEFKRDLEEAAKWYRKSIFESDDPIAHLGLGRMYFEGSVTVKRDVSQAQIHLNKAYINDVPQAGIYLGIMSMFGVGSEKNLEEAVQFFLTAATGGFPLAYRYLASIAISSGKPFYAIKMLIKGFFLTMRLKIQDRNHPNLWGVGESWSSDVLEFRRTHDNAVKRNAAK